MATKQGSTGGKITVPVATIGWTGRLRRLDTDEETEFKESLPLRRRGAQLLLDPFDATDEQVSVSGRVLSPGRVLDPASEVHAWVDGTETTVGDDGRFEAQAKLAVGHDQVTFRAVDATKVPGRGSVATFRPAPAADAGAAPPEQWDADAAPDAGGGDTSPDDPSDVEPLAFPECDGASGDDDAPADDAPAASVSPASYGRTRAEVQTFAITPAMPDHDSIVLALVGEDGSDLGQVELPLTHTDDASTTEAVCITTAVPGDDSAPAVEGKVLRAPGVKATLELRLDGERVGEPIRLSGWDPAKAPPALAKVDAQGSASLAGLLGGRFEASALAPRWLVDADADGVLIPGDRGQSEAQAFASLLGSKSDALEAKDPVDFSSDTVAVPQGWAALELAGTELGDAWEHSEVFPVLAYSDPDPQDETSFTDFALAPARKKRQVHDDDGLEVRPDQVVIGVEDGTGDDRVLELCSKYALGVAATARRYRYFALESEEPLAPDELLDLCQKLGQESGVTAACPNLLAETRTADAFSIRAPEILRAAMNHSPQPGCWDGHSVFAMKHLFQIRAYPAQQALARLLAEMSSPPTSSIAVLDSGFSGLGTSPDFTPEDAATRFPWGAFALPDISKKLDPSDPKIADTFPSPGHGTLVIHAAAGHGSAVHPHLAATPAPSLGQTSTLDLLSSPSRKAQPFCAGVAPLARLLPILALPGGGASKVDLLNALGAAVAVSGIDVINCSLGLRFSSSKEESDTKDVVQKIGKPIFESARAKGKVIVFSAAEGNDIWDSTKQHQPYCKQSLFDYLSPTAARSSASDPPIVLVGATDTQVIGYLLAATPDNFMNGKQDTGIAREPDRVAGIFFHPANEPKDLAAWWATRQDPVETPAFWSGIGPQISVGAPGEWLYLRALSGDWEQSSHFGTPGTRQGWTGTGHGTSFAAPLVSGLFALLYLADRIKGRTHADPAAFALQLIETVEYTATKRKPLMTDDELTAKFSEKVGHGRIDCWAAVLTVLNGGRMSNGTAPHDNLASLGDTVAKGELYGFELDTRVLHAKPMLVNVDTGKADVLADAHAVEPVCDPKSADRELWTYQMRAIGGDRNQPVSVLKANGLPLHVLQLTVRRKTLEDYTHLVWVRPGDQPAPVETKGGGHVNPGERAPAAVYWGLPLSGVLAHDLSTDAMKPWSMTLEHFICSGSSREHDRRLRLTVTELFSSKKGAGTYKVQGTVNGEALASADVPVVPRPMDDWEPGATGARVGLGGAGWSVVFFQPADKPLAVSFDVTLPDGSTETISGSWPRPTTPLATDATYWGLGSWLLSGPTSSCVFSVRVENEPNLPRAWRAELVSVKVQASTKGKLAFAVESGSVRSTWTKPAATAKGQTVKPKDKVVAISPWVPGTPLVVGLSVWNADTGEWTRGSATVTGADAKTATATVTVQAEGFAASVKVSSLEIGGPAFEAQAGSKPVPLVAENDIAADAPEVAVA